MSFLVLEGVGGGQQNAWISSAPSRWFDGKSVVFPPVKTSKELKKYAEDPSRKPTSKWVSYPAKIRRSFGNLLSLIMCAEILKKTFVFPL